MAARANPRLQTPGESAYAVRSTQPWDSKDRTKPVHGLVVHTTGSGLPSRARKDGIYPTVAATRYYQRSHGTHYVMGWRGVDGDLVQVANERERATGVGTRETREAIKLLRDQWGRDLPASFVQRWRSWWKHANATNPLDLFPGTWANNVYVHVEMPPCRFHHQGKLVLGMMQDGTEAQPRRTNNADIGLRFTQAQHDGIILLALDLARRYEWPDQWWLTGHLVGHEDLSPHTRTVKSGGWDPGHLRAKPYFDFGYVRNEIARMSSK